MRSVAASTFEQLTTIVQVLGADAALRAWFEALRHQSESGRHRAIHAMIQRMVADQEDPEWITALRLLADARIFRAVQLAVDEIQ